MQSYIAKVTVISEIASILQSFLNVYGLGLSYFNLMIFFSLCLPLFFVLKVSMKELSFVIVFFILILLKYLYQGVDVYYLKAGLLLLTLPVYFFLARKTTINHIVDACRRYRVIIFLLGGMYFISWLFLGTYRNASTVNIFLMLMLGYGSIFSKFSASITFAAVMKTQYKAWAAITLVMVVVRENLMRRAVLIMFAFVSIMLPLVLVFVDLSETSFSLSQISSLEERLREVRSFKTLLNSQFEYLVYGWPLGSVIESSELSDRGYMHSAYLWIIGTLGIPLSLVVFTFIVFRKVFSIHCFLVKVFLLLSNTFTFLLFTNPLGTMLLFANEKKQVD